MKTFDCLHPNSPIFGPHLLEASAGTGKTFSIEHVFVRLLLEKEGMEIDQILAVTFTKAATRDLKRRIRTNLEQALFRIREKREEWPYLIPFFSSNWAEKKLSDAISTFDQVQIFTIHGFCYRMLKQFAFEAKLKLSLQDPDGQKEISEPLLRAAKTFLETKLDASILCPEQMSWLYKEYETERLLIRRLLKGKKEKPAPFFSELLQQFEEKIGMWQGAFPEEKELMDQFNLISPSFKKIRDADFEGQVKALAKPSSQTFRILLKEKGSLFFFLSPENKKVKATAALPPFFQWALENLLPIIAQGMNPKTLLGSLQSAFETYAKNVLAEEQTIDPDEILKKMRAAIEQEEFASRIQGKYRAAIIDEFQDTDPLQWEIFKTLFLSPSSNLRAFYLVGDPKQSIYRFRSADVYTYFEAKKILGSDALFSLDTNFRSSSSLIDALNALFYRNWLPLPKIGEQIPCPPVKAGQKEPLKIADGKEAIHFLIGDSFEESFLPFTVLEIEKLLPKFSPTSFAILVRDRYGMDLALKALERRSIPAIAKSNTSLSETLGFQAVKEFFMALVYPKDMSLKRRVAMGPFANIPQDVSLNFIELCRFFPTSFEGTKEILEILLIWEGKEGYSPQKLLQFLEDFAKLEPEEGNVRQIDTEKEAVQIMTLHASKGLEFDVVFALGLSVRPPKTEDDEIVEMEAEKLRQLYVAMTRAKSRLYVPLPLERSKGRGSFSAAESFCQTLISQEGDLVSFLERTKNVSYEKLPAQIPLSLVPKKNVEELPLSSFSIPSFSPSFLHSFTSLSRPEVSELHFNQNPLFTPHTIPPGTEIGILVHKVFERLFSSVRNDPIAVNQVVLEEVEATSFLPWKEAISEMIWKTLCLPLPFGCSLKDLQVDQVQAEMEFFFSDSPHFIKGFIDLVFLHEEKLYFVDWKTNWLGNDDLAYQSLEKVMTEHDYWLQAKLYKEALKRNVKRFYTRPFDEIFGGAIYLFVRGGGICHFNPN